MPEVFSFLFNNKTDEIFLGYGLNSHVEAYARNGLTTSKEIFEIEWTESHSEPETIRPTVGCTESILQEVRKKIIDRFPTRNDFIAYLRIQRVKILKELKTKAKISYTSHMAFIINALTNWPGITRQTINSFLKLTLLQKQKDPNLYIDPFIVFLILHCDKLSKSKRKSLLEHLSEPLSYTQIAHNSDLFTLKELRSKIFPYMTNNISIYYVIIKYGAKLTKLELMSLLLRVSSHILFIELCLKYEEQKILTRKDLQFMYATLKQATKDAIQYHNNTKFNELVILGNQFVKKITSNYIL